MEISRRKFVSHGLAALSFALSANQFASLAAQAADRFTGQAGNRRILVAIQLSGGNDGLNTVVPYSSAAYYGARPNLAIPAEQVLKLDNHTGLHPNMDKLAALYKDGKLAVIQNTGYPDPNRSHFRSSEIWQTAEPHKIGDSGWLGRYLDSCTQASEIFPAVNLDPLLPLTLQGHTAAVPSVSNINNFKFFSDPRYQSDDGERLKIFEDIYADFELNRPYVELLREAGANANKSSKKLQQLVRNYRSEVVYPQGEFGNTLKFVAQMIAGGLLSRVYTLSLGGFDTHTAQPRNHPELLRQLSDGIAAFYQDLVRHNCQQEVIIMTFSEFGRRVAENGSRGTDHGTAAPMFMVGHNIKGGIIGEAPDLNNLDNGDLKFAVDFRQVYASVLESWLKADSKRILGQSFETLPIFTQA